VPATAFLLALSAAFIHALWNLLLAQARDTEAATAVAVVVGVVAFTPAALLTWDVDVDVWPYAIASTSFELVYIVLLAAAYGRSELSLVYPLARGIAPVVVLVVAIAALGAPSSAAQAAGVCVIGLGVVLVRGRREQPDPRGVVFGLMIAGAIAGYTLIDNAGVEHADPLPYLILVMAPASFVYFAAIAWLRGPAALRAEVKAPTLVAGIASVASYALALAALQLAPAAPVAAVRETSVVIAAALAWIVLKEKVGPARLAGAALVAGGVVLLGT
jgi:drug/metabolite transporter (DMT)-like permease